MVAPKTAGAGGGAAARGTDGAMYAGGAPKRSGPAAAPKPAKIIGFVVAVPAGVDPLVALLFRPDIIGRDGCHRMAAYEQSGATREDVRLSDGYCVLGRHEP